MGKKPIVSVTYENERISIKKQLTLHKMCVTSLLCGPRADLWSFYGLYCKRFSLSINKTLSRGDRLPPNPGWGEGGWSGVGVVIFTPWCFMLHHCFADPLACFRCIFWNV